MTSERLVNMYAEASPSARLPVTIRSCPGLVNVGQFHAGRVKSMISTTDGIYAVVDDRLCLWNGSTFSTLGTVTDGSPTMAWNGSVAGEVGVVSGGNYYVWNGSTLTQITAGDFTDYGSIAFVDGYFAITQLDGFKHTVTALYGGSTIDAADVASAEHNPDNLLRVMSNAGLIWYMGTESIEPWQNVGAADFPFAPVQSAVIEKGLRSTPEAALLDNTIIWTSHEPKVYRHVNLAPQRVSAHAVEASLESAGSCVSFTYQHQGHDFYVVRPDNRPAWVYDAATQSWHERSSDTTYGPWDATASVFHGGVWYMGTSDGYLCTLGGFQERGEPFRREAISRNVSAGGDRFRVKRLDVRCSAGAGGTVMSRFSRDGGRTWSLETTRSLGATGVYGQRQRWHGFGECREFAAMMACADNVDFSIFEAGVNGNA